MGIMSPRLGIDTIPNFISARTPAGLRRAMLRNNTKQKGYVFYHHIQWVESEKRWYAWFDVKEEIQSLESLAGGGNGDR